MHKYKTWNGPMPTTAAFAKVTTGTAIKTMLQLSTPSTRQIQIIGWGFTLDAAPGTVGEVELVQTDVGATVTQHVAAGIQPLDPNAPASLLDISGVTKTGYTASGEGVVAATRVFDVKEIPVAAGSSDMTHEKYFMPDARPIIPISKWLRVRCTMGAAVNMVTWIEWDE
jgi:hypothetical protein